MKFDNDTPFAARLLRTEIVEGRMLNAAIARVRHRIGGDGALTPLPYEQQPTDIRVQPLDLGEYGSLQPDAIYPRTGVDVMLLGDVTPPAPVSQTEVLLRAGAYSVSLALSGQRVWERGALGGLSASKPTQFSRMPLSWSNAYGGSAPSEHGEIPFPKNPAGKGFILFEKFAVGTQLPNVELSDRLIKRWDDRPDPAGCAPYPMQWGMRTERVMAPDPEKGEMRFFPERGMFDHAVPYLAGKPLDPADVHIAGMRAEPIDFSLPPCPFVVSAMVGDKNYEAPLLLEEVIVDLRGDADPSGDRVDTVELCYRRSFHYAYVPRQRRRAWLRLAETA